MLVQVKGKLHYFNTKYLMKSTNNHRLVTCISKNVQHVELWFKVDFTITIIIDVVQLKQTTDLVYLL